MPRPRKLDRISNQAPDLATGCEESIVHMDAVRESRSRMPDSREVGEMTALFAALGDPTRLRIVAALATQELCVCDLAATVGLSQSAISHQLRSLRQLGLLRSHRAGRRVYYGLDDDHVSTLFDQAREHVGHIRHAAEVSWPVLNSAT